MHWLMLTLIVAACSTAPSPVAPPDTGTVAVEAFYAEALARDWTYSVYLPPGYETSDVRYPVLYLLHGSGGDEGDWRDGQDMLDSLITAGAVPPAIAVAPATGTSWWVDGQEPFETAFMQDLIPEIDRRYRTLAGREGRALAGFSMGGYGALRYGLAHADVFGAALLLSPALYDEDPPEGSSARTSGAFGVPFKRERWRSRNYPQAVAAYQEAGLDVPVFIVVGDDDWHHPEGLKYDIEQQSVLLYGRLHKEHGHPAELRILDGGHSWDVWGPGFEAGLAYVFQTIKHPEPRSE